MEIVICFDLWIRAFGTLRHALYQWLVDLRLCVVLISPVVSAWLPACLCASGSVHGLTWLAQSRDLHESVYLTQHHETHADHVLLIGVSQKKTWLRY